MYQRFLTFIRSKKLLENTDRLLIGVSGGVDSMVLAHLVLKTGIKFGIAHVNYKLRGEESDKDARLVSAWCESQRIPFYLKEVNPMVYESGKSIQMVARDIRYDFFSELMERELYTKVLTAHNASDNLETVLFNLTKGTGIAGMTGIAPAKHNIIRPLLFATKGEVYAFAKSQKIVWREDRSNAKNDYLRNLIRNEVIPILKKINPSLESTFEESLTRFSGAAELVYEEKEKIFTEHFQEAGGVGEMSLDWVRNDHRSLLLLSEVIKHYGFNFQDAKDLFQAIINGSSGAVFYAAEFEINLDRKSFYIRKRGKDTEVDLVVAPGTGKVKTPYYTLSFEDNPDRSSEPGSPDIAFLDADLITYPLKVRSWKKGDRFVPLGMKVTNLTRPGRFVISKPYLDVRVREDGSNLEDLIQTLLSRDRSKRGLSEGAIAIHDGRIDVHDPQGKLLATIEDVDFTGSHRRATEREIHFELTSLVVQEGQRRSLQAAADWRGPRNGLPLMSGKGTAAVKFDPFSLQLLQPYLKRLLPGLTIHKGSLAGQLLVECDFTDKMTLAATSQLLTTDLHATTHDNAGKTREYRWQDEELALQIDGTFDPQDDVVTVSDVTLQSTPVSMTASGTIADVHGESLVDVSGNLQYDVTPLIASLESEYGQHIHVEELQTRTIRIRGPLAHRIKGRPHWNISRLSLEADLGWKAADVFGVKSEQATIVAKVNNGVLSIDPRDVPVSGGRFTASPRVMFPNGQPVTHLQNGPALEDVQFSPEMCHLWLKYLSPPLADATRINGRFSISVEEGQIPLQRLADGQLRGQLHVHGAEVRPGAFAEKVIGIVGMVQTLIVGKAGWTRAASDRWLAMEDQQIPFVMEGGRVHHERLEFLVAGATVRTSGSVGFDDSVNLLISIPLPESWLDKKDLRGMLGGEVIRIPVRGTLDRPQFDLLPLRELAQRMAMRATGGLLQKLLD